MSDQPRETPRIQAAIQDLKLVRRVLKDRLSLLGNCQEADDIDAAIGNVANALNLLRALSHSTSPEPIS